MQTDCRLLNRHSASRLAIAMPEHNPDLWAPWRSEYIRSLGDQPADQSCFLCDYGASPQADAENFVLCRSKVAFAVLNRYPYTNGHLLIAPNRHVGDLAALSDDELNTLSRMIRDSISILTKVVNAHGFNVGLNINRCAGAGLPGHVHWHVVPRWEGDTNFMTTVGSARIISESLEEVYHRYHKVAEEASSS